MRGVERDDRVAGARVQPRRAARRREPRQQPAPPRPAVVGRDGEPMFVAAPSNRRPTWYVTTVVRPTVRLSGSTSVSCWLSGSCIGIAGQAPAHELAVPGDGVGEVGVDEVGARAAADDVAVAVVLGDDAVGARACVDRVAAGAAVQEVRACAAEDPVAAFEAEDRVGPRRPREPVVARCADASPPTRRSRGRARRRIAATRICRLQTMPGRCWLVCPGAGRAALASRRWGS